MYLIEARHVRKDFVTKRNIFGKPVRTITPVLDVSLGILRGMTVGLVGESGCGKSTFLKTVLGLAGTWSGEIYYKGRNVLQPETAQEFRRNVQMIFQDPYSSLDPRMNIEDIISEPLYNYRIGTALQRRQKVAELLEQVELPKEAAHRYPFEFSGGQRQRIGIARALALNPECIFCDEPVSALDVSVQVQIINMLKRLQKERDLSYLFISHDLSVVYYMSDYIGIMYGGCIVEYGCSEDIYRRPLHPYTKLLLQSIPKAEPSRKKSIVSVLTEEKAEEGACAFYPRCSFSNCRCLIEVPVLKKYENNRVIACHYVEGGAVCGG